MKVDNFNGTWCVAKPTNLTALLKLGFLWDDNKLNNWKAFIIHDDNKEIDAGNYSWDNIDNYKQIILKNNEFHYIEEQLTEEQKEELEQLGINKAPECQFAKYGFEVPEFECEIYFANINSTDKETYYFSDSKDADCALYWDKEGACASAYNGSYVPKFNLTPIKKPWYEDENNFPKIMIRDKDIRFSRNRANYLHSLEIGYRLATKEEALSLVGEE